MPVISTRRYSSGSSSYLPPSIGGTTSSLSNLGKTTSSGYGSSYRSSSLTNSTYSSGYTGSGSSYLSRTSSIRSSGLYNTSSSLSGISSYRHSSYLTGGNNDTTAASRFGVSNNKYTRSSSDRDTKRITGKTQHNNNINTTTTVPSRVKPLQSKPPSGSYRSSQKLSDRASEQVTSKSDQNCNYNGSNGRNCNDISNNSALSSSTAGLSSTGQDQSDNTRKISSSLSSSSLARQVATSGLDLYEKYSPVHYIPKCELSRSRSLSEATTNNYNKENNLSNSSSNVHQLLHQKDTSKLQDTSKDCKATAATARRTSSPSATRDISTAQLASKVNKLFDAVPNAATNHIVASLNASSIVVLNNCNNSHSPQKIVQIDANNTPNKSPLQTDSSSALLNDKTTTNLSSSETTIASTASGVLAQSSNQSVVSLVDTNNSVNDNCHCTHSYTTSNHREQAIQTCRNCNRTTATVLAATTLSQTPPTSSEDGVFTNNSNTTTIISVNSSNNRSDNDIKRSVSARVAELNLHTTKQLLSKTSDEGKNMSSNFYTKHWGETNNASTNSSSPSSVTVTYHTTTTKVTIQSPNTVTTINANTKPLKLPKSSNLFDFRLDYPKHKQIGKVQSGNIPAIAALPPPPPLKEAPTKNGNGHFFGQNLLSTFKDQNFLKNECELARSQVIKLNSEEESRPASENNNNYNTPHASQDVIDKSTTSKHVVRPLVHKTNNRIFSKLTKITNNNMNCIQNSSEFLDDIKYIDSDDSERQHNGQTKSASTSSSSGSSSSTSYDKQNFNHTKIATSTSSTLPLTSKQQRDLITSDSSSKATATNKFNTLNDFKRIPSSVRSTNSFLTNNKSSSTISASASIPNRITALTNSIKPKASVVSTVINNISNSSRESTPPNSPQMLRRNYLLNNGSSSSLAQQQQQQHIPDNSPSSSTTTLNDRKLSNKLICDIDESVRNASIRSALPPSPTPSRYWDREGRSSGLSSRYNDVDDYSSSTKSASNSSSESTEGLCGLRNIGNTCFMNSVIQCLSHTRELTKFLKTQTSVRSSSSKDQQILYEFAKLIRKMWTPNTPSVTPLDLKSAFSSKHRMYSGYNQQDAQEFLRFFLDSLHCALNIGVKGEHLKIDDSLSDNKKADLVWDWYSKIENTVIKDLFVGQLKSTLKCTTCGNTSVTFDPFWDLSVPLPSSSRCKLDSCLDLFIKEEVLDGDEMPTCSKCQTRRKCTKTFTIQRFPKYLVIHLKRFSETRWSKMSNIVEFPTGERELNMAPYAANSCSNVLYSLYAISNHMGSTAGGHYVALCKHPTTKKWHEFNDNVVSDDLSENVLVSSSAYLLFYERAN